VGNAREEYMDADYDCQGNKDEQADGYEKNPEHIHRAMGNCKHRGLSVSPAGTPRNITDRGYGGADKLP
jgi:hypothetical protein